MAKNIQWKKSTIDYDKLNKLTPKSLSSTERGNMNVESGHLTKISGIVTSASTKASIENGLKGLANFEKMSEEHKHDSRSRGGKTSGNNAVKSGQYEEFRSAGTKAAVAKQLEKTLGYKQKLYSLIQLEKFTTNDILHLYKEFDHLSKSQMIRKWVCDTDFFTVIGKKGSTKIYTKSQMKQKN
tara:strand:- start:109 stop:657 length:549 start_codon:yes stop_codon:yes gene_type:complete